MEKVAILDCGGQYIKVIDRKVRELLVNTDILPIQVESSVLKAYQAIILSGGPSSVWSEDALGFDKDLFDLGVPILGICYGMQLITDHFGGKVSPSVKKEYGVNVVEIDPSSPIFTGLNESQWVLMSHGDSVLSLPDGFKVIAKSEGIVAGIANDSQKIYGLQFHPEVDMTPNGKSMLEHFLRDICQLKEEYLLEDRIETSIKMIRKKVGDQKVMVLVSGGVDSAVTASLLLRALPAENVYAIHVDHGFMRKNESDLVCKNLKKSGFKYLIREDAKERFWNATIELEGKRVGPLTQVVDPEEKRKIIGEVFIKTVEDVIHQLGLNMEETFIAQGTLRPDLIESGNKDVSSYAHIIKTHHNDVELVRRAREKGLIIETNWDWHKDEVRKVGRMLGLSEEIVERQPFPGPGLSLRVLCHHAQLAVQPEDKEKMKRLLEKTDYKGTILPIKSVGVQGDARSYKNLSILYGKGLRLDYAVVSKLAKEVTDEVHSINRVGYILNQEIIDGEVKCHEMLMNDETVELVRELDHIVTSNLSKKISQSFAVLVPIGITKKYSVVIRTFMTSDFMTGRAAIIGEEESVDTIKRVINEIMGKFGEQIEFVIYDVTSKPPATCEWQ